MLTTLVYLQQDFVKKSKKLMKIVHIEEENLYIFRTTWDISMKFLGKMWLTINDNIKRHEKPGFTLSIENTFLEKQQKRGGSQIKPPTFLGLTPSVH